ncbi:alpha/beta hydrolase family protein [Xanthomarina spongicola]|uniref:Dipeptidyl aminopeptidase/acylaminoacyl peptidase n=1 Tax=Xanthomarina spongicola TaxID=570520 RepID=A0A316DQ57_9FLAO|nr:prolyl oligopeptidase family serine peptidase [Xanthomarina spongicola]PWK19299.1 dipeptidyl aminopeptidase/acylaminoacyl peptidase [Xanthomarina spongicola]
MKKLVFILPFLFFIGLLNSLESFAQEDNTNGWKSPDEDILKVLYAPQLPRTSTSPPSTHMILTDPIYYPSLSELAGPMLKLAGTRVNPKNNYYHGRHGGTSPRIVTVKDGKTVPINIPKDAEVISTDWTVDGQRFALSVAFEDRVELWLGDISGKVEKVQDIILNPLMDQAVKWLPNQEDILIRRIHNRGPVPQEPSIPNGPMILEDAGASARSTYESRNLLETTYDDELFSYYTQCELVIYNTKTKKIKVIGPSASYMSADISPDGNYLLVERLKKPWSHEVAWWRFANDAEVWNLDGKLVKTVVNQPLANEVPIHGVITGPRNVSWQPTAPHTLFWTEALDGGNPVAEVEYRDRLMSWEAPFNNKPNEVFKAEHRIQGTMWGQKDGMLMVYQRERMKRWRYVWLLDVDKNTSKLWFDLDENDFYNDPGYPIFTQLNNGKYVFKVEDGSIYFRGNGGSEDGDRPFVDQRNIETGETQRIFRSDKDKYEYFIDFAATPNTFIMSSESTTEVPNLYLATFGETIAADAGESTRAITKHPITTFKDPSPELRQIENKIVKYQRNDGIELSFQLLLPPGYKEGTKLPTVVYAYPLEYSGGKTAGQVRGSSNRFMRIYGPSHKYFLMRGYAVLDNTAMPMIGDPETVYDTFVPQLVADAEAAVNKAVEMGIADPERIGIIGHSHGGLMVANLLAHSDLFAAGIARSGSYNKTNQPYGFQGERRSLFEATESYIDCSPTFFANKVNEPILIIHGNDDSNPGTLTFQSEVFYEAVRGSGGTARLVLLPFEDHGYRAKESIEHVLWEQINWFDKYVKNREIITLEEKEVEKP